MKIDGVAARKDGVKQFYDVTLFLDEKIDRRRDG